MTLLLDDFGGGWLGSLDHLDRDHGRILAIITWTVAGQRMERWMTDPAIAPRLFPVLGGVLALLGALIAVRGPDRRSDRGSEPHGSNNAPTGTSFEDGEGTTAERADDGDPEELMTDHVRSRKTGEGDASDDGCDATEEPVGFAAVIDVAFQSHGQVHPQPFERLFRANIYDQRCT